MNLKTDCVVSIALMVAMGNALPTLNAGDLAVVGFDVPAVVVAEPVAPSLVEKPTGGGKLVRLRINVSTFLSSDFRGQVEEYVVELESRQQTARIVDFWPRNEMYSEIAGNIAVQNSRQRDGEVSFTAGAALEPFGRATAQGSYQDKQSTQTSFQRKPPMQILTSSGTIRRGYGVFFKFHPGQQPTLEGTREVSILMEVPVAWRADMLQANLRAYGKTTTSQRHRLLGQSRLWLTTHQEGDTAAAALTRRYVAQERSLRALAASSGERVQERALPTWWHKLGDALEVVEPRIPHDYLEQVVFGPRNQYFTGPSHRLPVDLRVAILDYWEVRNHLMTAADPSAYDATTAHSGAAPRTHESRTPENELRRSSAIHTSVSSNSADRNLVDGNSVQRDAVQAYANVSRPTQLSQRSNAVN